MKESSRCILVVDDDVDSCSNARDILNDLGYCLDTAHSGADALQLVRERQYDVALLDFNMPDIDGLSLFREIKRLQPSTVAIIVTAHAGADTRKDAEEVGAWRIVHKPVEFNELLSLIDEALQRHHRRRPIAAKNCQHDDIT